MTWNEFTSHILNFGVCVCETPLPNESFKVHRKTDPLFQISGKKCKQAWPSVHMITYKTPIPDGYLNLRLSLTLPFGAERFIFPKYLFCIQNHSLPTLCLCKQVP